MSATPANRHRAWILAALAVAVLAAGVFIIGWRELIGSLPFMSEARVTLVGNAFRPMLIAAVLYSIPLAVVAFIIGLIIALLVALVRVVPATGIAHRLLLAVVHAYVSAIRGTPMLVQLYIFYYGIGLVIGRIPGVRELALWPLLRQAWPWVMLSFILNTAAYTAEIVRGAIETTPKGEIEAAKALGMNRRQIQWRIILPGAARRALPAYGNEIIFMLHGSAIASTATLLDITGVANTLYTRTYEPFAPFLTAAVIYLAITLCIVGIFRRIEKRLNRHL